MTLASAATPKLSSAGEMGTRSKNRSVRDDALGSLAAATTFPVTLAFLERPRDLMLMGMTVALLICVRHHDNLKRLLRGEEGQV